MKPPAALSSSGSWFGLLLALVGLGPVLLFWGTIGADFVQWDDDLNLYGNPHLRGLTGSALSWALTDFEYARRYMPAGWIGWLCNYELDGLNPATYHLGNVLLHGLNAILVFLLLRQWLDWARLGAEGRAEMRWRDLGAAFAALLWAVHPLRVEPVAWASGRLYCQATFFLLLSSWCYFRFVRPAGGGWARAWPGYYWLAVLCYAASLLTYPVGAGWVFLFVLADFYPLRRLSGPCGGWWRPEYRRVWLEKAPFLGVAALVLGLTFWARWQTGDVWRPPPTLEEFGLGSRAMQAFYIWACYVWKTGYPADLSPLYATLISFDPNGVVFWLSLVLVVGSSWMAIRFRRRFPTGLVLWSAYLVLLVPVLGWTEHPHYPADRYSYLAGICLSVLAGALFYAALTNLRTRSWSLAAGTILIGLFCMLSARQVGVWRDSETLFKHMLSTLGTDPQRFDVFHRLGQFYMSKARFEEAEKCFRQELEIRPELPRALFSLGNALALRRELGQAAQIYLRLLGVAPSFPRAHFNLGQTYAEMGDATRAVQHFQRALEEDPNDPNTHFALAETLTRQGQYELALHHYGVAQGLAPSPELEQAVRRCLQLSARNRPLLKPIRNTPDSP